MPIEGNVGEAMMPRCSDGLSMGRGTSNRCGWGGQGEIAVEARKRRGVMRCGEEGTREDAKSLMDLIDHVASRSGRSGYSADCPGPGCPTLSQFGDKIGKGPSNLIMNKDQTTRFIFFIYRIPS
jgi:hypothetical protein